MDEHAPSVSNIQQPEARYDESHHAIILRSHTETESVETPSIYLCVGRSSNPDVITEIRFTEFHMMTMLLQANGALYPNQPLPIEDVLTAALRISGPDSVSQELKRKLLAFIGDAKLEADEVNHLPVLEYGQGWGHEISDETDATPRI